MTSTTACGASLLQWQLCPHLLFWTQATSTLSGMSSGGGKPSDLTKASQRAAVVVAVNRILAGQTSRAFSRVLTSDHRLCFTAMFVIEFTAALRDRT